MSGCASAGRWLNHSSMKSLTAPKYWVPERFKNAKWDSPDRIGERSFRGIESKSMR
jgi:hypothetical protein